ncbi:MAG: hypothetical protein ACLTKI_01550 [Lachnospiraceae bacterium]
MKKHLRYAVMLVMLLLLTACGKSEAAKTVDEQIAAIGEVTLDSESKIAAAEEAVEALAEEDKKQLENVEALTTARITYEALVLESEAQKVEDLITAIGTVTLESREAIDAAAAAYESAPAEVQALVENASALDAAEGTWNDLQVAQVVELINAIGTVTIESSDSIEAAKTAFDALSGENQAKVENQSTLEEAEEQVKALKQEQAAALLANMNMDEDKVQNVRFYMPKAIKQYDDSWAADVRCFVLPYIGQDSGSSWLRCICNYTEDDWVFFEKIIFAVDDKRYTKFFSYYDIVRDNAYGDVWEYADFEPTEDDIKMLWEIADSTETIVRFEGDEYYYDFTVNATDKEAIKEVLTAYEALN